jgi:hypothetical protein
MNKLEPYTHLRTFYEKDAPSCYEVLDKQDVIKELLRGQCLAFFLRYVENIPLIYIMTSLKTMMLVIKFCQLEPERLRQIVPFQKIEFDLVKIAKTDDSTELVLAASKITTYLNYLLEGGNSAVPDQKQLEILT